MRPARGGAVALGLIAALSSCAYYNAMWSAERFAKEARQLEAQGRPLEARGQWARAAVKAESVMVRHPRSRWADDALVLRGEGLARAGSCDIAAAPIAKARATVSEASLRERAGLAAAQCALAAGKPVDAEQALVDALASEDAGRRSRAAYLAGQAAAARLDYDAAIALLGRSREPGAWPARARVLLAAGRPAEAAAVFDTAAGWMSETERVELLAGLGEAASPALDRLLARGAGARRVPFAERARLLIADGDRRLARGDYEGATARYREAQAAAPAADEAGVAQVRAQRVLAVRAVRRSELGPVIAELTRLARPAGGVGTAGGVPAARGFLDLLSHIASTPETPGAAFRAAELARDSLNAPLLAGQLFLDIAAADSGSLYAPKALVAALALLPARSDSILGVLDAAYATSPYTRVLHGEANPAYAAAEDSLARELGVQVTRALPAALGAVRGEVPLTGPRGPWLETPAERRSGAQPPSPSPVARPRPGERRPPAATPDRPAAPARP